MTFDNRSPNGGIPVIIVSGFPKVNFTIIWPDDVCFVFALVAEIVGES